MKKIFTFIFALMALAANAQTTQYNGVVDIYAVLFGVESPLCTQENTIDVTKQDDGNYTITLDNFHLTMYGIEMYIGNVCLVDIEATEEDGAITLSTEQTIEVPAGDDPEGVTWMGPDLGEVKVTLEGTISDDTIKLAITIPVGMDVKVYFEVSALEDEEPEPEPDPEPEPEPEPDPEPDPDPSPEDGIQSVSTTVISNGTPYTLQGVKAGANYKGIVIEDGRKVLK